MPDINKALAANRAAVNDLLSAGERSEGAWATPRAPGKWSPSQIVEHIALSLEESANLLAGAPAKFPKLPFFVRPLIRRLVFDRVLRTGTFPKGRTTKPLNPAVGSSSAQEARSRMETTLARFDQECRARAATGQKVVSTIFGPVTIEDYVRFQELHVRHHCKQMPAGIS